METIIRIKKSKPAFKALILLAKELEKTDQSSISITEGIQKKGRFDLINPTGNANESFLFFDQLTDFPTLVEIRKQAWPKI